MVKSKKVKYEKRCDFCQCIVEKRTGIVKQYQIKDFGTIDKPFLKRICIDCDSKFSNLYGVRK